ncbi:MAG: preprotein translocase subunit SecE [Chloroflexi bacterium]|nr:preprotein translocase subunit SecE [Chloroflexota bacterium]
MAARAKGARGPVRPVPKTAGARPAAPSRTAGLASVAGWRPRFVMDIIAELRKTVWPSRQTTLHLTVVVVVVGIIMGAVLGGIDVGFGWLIDRALLGQNFFDRLGLGG